MFFFVGWVVISRYFFSKTERGHHKPHDFFDAQRIVRLVFVGVAFVPRGSVDLGVEWSASNFRVSSMLANQRTIGPFPRLRTMLVSMRL